MSVLFLVCSVLDSQYPLMQQSHVHFLGWGCPIAKQRWVGNWELGVGGSHETQFPAKALRSGTRSVGKHLYYPGRNPPHR